MMEIQNLFEIETIEEIPEEVKEDFVIDTPQKANWAIRVIKEERKRRDIFNETAELEIERLKQQIEKNNKKCDYNTGFLLSNLGEYMETLPTKKSKTLETFTLPEGKLKRKLARLFFEPNEKELVEYLKEEPEYIKVSKKADWAEFKKLLAIKDNKVIRTDTGEILNCITIEEKPATFDIE